jgi:hypothetical protein
MNSGDWVETLSALVEDSDGNWSLLYYNQQQAEHETKNEKPIGKTMPGNFPGVEKQVAFTGILPDKDRRIL